MNILDFINKHLGEHKISGKEILVKKCPYCNNEKYKLSINTDKNLFQCFSGSCRTTGHISKLYNKFNVVAPEFKNNTKNADIKIYINPITEEIYKWFETERKISRKTIKLNTFDVMSDKNGNVSFIYRKGFEVNSIKCRSIKEKKFYGEKIKDLTLWKLDFCDIEKPLIICEGEIDQLSFEEQGIENAVSVPAGVSSLSWIDTDFEILEKFETIYISFDSDKAGKEGIKKLIKRLPETCEIKIINYINLKDANEVHCEGLKLQDFIDNAYSLEDEYIIKMLDINTDKKDEVYSTGILSFDRAIGGIRTGELNLWTGQPGSAKSTILNQVMLNVLQQGVKGLVYTPELANKQYKDWTCRQLLDEGKGSFDKYFDEILKEENFIVKKEISDKMSFWLDKRLINITNKKNLTDKEILRLIIKHIKKNDVKFIIIDNLMKVIFEEEVGEIKLHTNFLNSLSEICKDYNVSINLVAHPKKHDKTQPDQYDIAGTANIPNLVDNIYYLRRITDWCINNDFKDISEEIIQENVSTALMSLKSRYGKKIGEWNFYCFDVLRKSIYDFSEGKKHLNNWKENKEIKKFLLDEVYDDIPVF